MALAKAQRALEFLNRLLAAPAAKSSEEAFALVVSTLNEVEDEFSSVPFDPSRWIDDGRMYSAEPDSAPPRSRLSGPRSVPQPDA